MTQTARKPASTKKATILNRIDKGNGDAEYIVQSSNGKDEYTIECINHVIQDCPCAHHQFRKVVCYHMRSCQIAELEVEEQEQQAAALAEYDIQSEADKVAIAADTLYPLDVVMATANANIAQLEQVDAPDAYAVLATSKSVDMPSCHYCGRPGYRVCPKCLG